MNIVLAVLPFVTGLVLKVCVFLLSGNIQEAALNKLLLGHLPKDGGPALDENQKKVLLGVIGFSTASLTAASTLIASLITFLVVAIKHPLPWVWWVWILDLVLSASLWVYVQTRKHPEEPLFRLKAGTFLLLLSGLLDGLGLISTLVATQK
jgi:hypothetical protein